MQVQAVGNKIPKISNYAKSTVAALMLATSPLLLQAKNTDSFQKEEISISQTDEKNETSKENKKFDVVDYILLLGGLAYTGAVTKRLIKKPKIDKIAQNFSEIYRREISEEEAEKMCKKYKEIFDIKDEKEFQQTLFEQVKKDYGLEDTEWGLYIKK